MHTDQGGCGTYFKQKMHGTDMDTTGMEAYLGDAHLPHGYSHSMIFLHVTNTMMMSQGERKLDRLKRESRGATNEVSTCAVPRHAPQMSSR